jgi:Family of unknown function (DUF6049)
MQSTRGGRLGSWCLLCLVGVWLVLGNGTLTAAAAQPDDSSVRLELVAQPLWYSKGDHLALSLRISNDGSETVEGAQLQVYSYDRVANRTALHDSFEQPPEEADVNDLVTRDLVGTSIAPGGSRAVELDPSVSDLIEPGSPDGVYPLEIRLYSNDDLVDTITSGLTYYEAAPQSRLNLVLVWPLTNVPQRSARGTFEAGPGGRLDLRSDLARGGWLDRTVRGLLSAVRGSALHLGIAPTPRLVEEIADLADGYLREDAEEVRRAPAAPSARGFLARSRRLLSDPSVQPLLVPYSAPDLPTLHARLRATTEAAAEAERDPLQDQLQQAKETLRAALGDSAARRFDSPWLFPPGSRMDARTLNELQLPEWTQGSLGRPYRTFFSAAALRDTASGCPGDLTSFTCPVAVETEDKTLGFVADGGLQDRLAALARPGDDALDLQRFFAETATIREELPQVGNRVVHVAAPALWQPSSSLLRSLLTNLARAPWLKTQTPRHALHDDIAPTQRQIREEALPAHGAPGESYFASIADASLAVGDFASLRPRDLSPTEQWRGDQLLERLQSNILVAQSRLWWSDIALMAEGATYARATEQEADDHLGRIRVGGRDELTLTSSRQPIPVVLFNRNPFAVQVTVRLDSRGELDFDGAPDRIFEHTLVPPGNQPLTAVANARSSGTFTLDVSVLTPNGQEITDQPITIRSTRFNKIALGITIGALAFLVLFYTSRAVRNRRRPPEPDPGTAAA